MSISILWALAPIWIFSGAYGALLIVHGTTRYAMTGSSRQLWAGLVLSFVSHVLAFTAGVFF